MNEGEHEFILPFKGQNNWQNRHTEFGVFIHPDNILSVSVLECLLMKYVTISPFPASTFLKTRER
jgi:hypothetical protein